MVFNFSTGMSLALAPTHPQRRMRHALSLTQRLLSVERRLSEKEAELAAAQKAQKELENERESLKVQLTRCGRPAVYLTEKLQEEETRRVLAEQRTTAAQQELQKTRDLLQILQRDYEGLRERMQVLLAQRQDLQVVKQLLRDIEESESESDSDSDSDSEAEIPAQRERSKKHVAPSSLMITDKGESESKLSTPPRGTLLAGSLSRSPSLSSTHSDTQRHTSRNVLDPLAQLAQRLRISPSTLRHMTTPPSNKNAHRESFSPAQSPVVLSHSNRTSAPHTSHSPSMSEQTRDAEYVSLEREPYTVTPFGVGAVHGIRQVSFKKERDEKES